MANTIDDLYAGLTKLLISFREMPQKFDVELTKLELNVQKMEFEKTPDCLVGSWTLNFWFRTKKGVNREKYKSISSLKQSITLSAKRRGLTVQQFELTKIE